MNIYERPNGLIRFPDTGDFVEQWPGGTRGCMKQGHKHFHDSGTMCMCHDRVQVGRNWRALAYRPPAWLELSSLDIPEREMMPGDDGPDLDAFSTAASRALIANHEWRSTTYGNQPGYLTCGTCKRKACDCPIDVEQIASGYKGDNQ